MSNKFSSGRMSVCCDGVYQTFVSGSLLLHVLALCGVYIGQSCLICSVLDVCGVVVMNIHVVSGRFLWSL